MVVPAPLLGMVRNPIFNFVRNVFGNIIFGRIIFFEADHDAFLFAPSAERDDACSHLVYFLRESQVERGGATE